MLYPVLRKEVLVDLYVRRGMSMMEISKHQGCSHHKVAYWMGEYKIKRRSISDAVYLKSNPNGDPFKIKSPKTTNELILFGLGVGLYWGEGNKAHHNAVRIGNSDPRLLKCYILFLTRLCGVNKDSLKFDLQLFSDTNTNAVLRYWCRELEIKKKQFFRPRVTISGSLGTYRKKSKYGVVTIYFGNTKLRDIIVGQIVLMASAFDDTLADKKPEVLGRHSSVVEHTHGKRKVPSSILGVGSRASNTTSAA